MRAPTAVATASAIITAKALLIAVVSWQRAKLLGHEPNLVAVIEVLVLLGAVYVGGWLLVKSLVTRRDRLYRSR